MKTKNLLKASMTMIAVFVVSATFAQENEPWPDMETNTGVPDSVVVGDTLPYYVEPDPILNDLSGTYDTTSTNGTQGINSTFSWSSTNGAVSFIAPVADADAPFRRVVFGAGTEDTDDVPVTVQEIGAQDCPGTSEDKLVDVISEPGFTTDATHNITICDGTTDTVKIESILDDDIAGKSKYYFLMDIDKRATNSDRSTYSTIYTHADTVVQIDSADGSGGIGLIVQNFTAATADLGDGEGDVKRITEYRFDFSNNLGGDDIAGLNHHISRKGDFLNLSGAIGSNKTQPDFTSGYNDNTTDNTTDGYGGDETLYTWYNPNPGTITVTVVPAPNTGNIYHVPNTFEQ